MKLHVTDKSLTPGTVFQVLDENSPSNRGIFVVAEYTGPFMHVLEVTGSGTEGYVTAEEIPSDHKRKVIFRSGSYTPEKTAQELRRLQTPFMEAVDLGLDVYLMGSLSCEPLWITYKSDTPLFRRTRYAMLEGSEDSRVFVEIDCFDLANIGIIDQSQVHRSEHGDSYDQKLLDMSLSEDRARASFEALAKYGVGLNSRLLVDWSPVIGGTNVQPCVAQRLKGYIVQERVKPTYDEMNQSRDFSSIREAHQAVLDLEERIRTDFTLPQQP